MTFLLPFMISILTQTSKIILYTVYFPFLCSAQIPSMPSMYVASLSLQDFLHSLFAHLTPSLAGIFSIPSPVQSLSLSWFAILSLSKFAILSLTQLAIFSFSKACNVFSSLARNIFLLESSQYFFFPSSQFCPFPSSQFCPFPSS